MKCFVDDLEAKKKRENVFVLFDIVFGTCQDLIMIMTICVFGVFLGKRILEPCESNDFIIILYKVCFLIMIMDNLSLNRHVMLRNKLNNHNFNLKTEDIYSRK